VAKIIQLNSVFGRDFTQKSCPKISTPAPSVTKPLEIRYDICMKYNTNVELKLAVVVAEVPTLEER
jgi:hypothetical protein